MRSFSRLLLAGLLLPLLLISCQVIGVEGSGPLDVEVDYGDTFRLREGGTATFPNALSLSLLEINEGRCPRDVSCVWSGEVAVTIRLSRPEWRAAPDTLRGYLSEEGGELKQVVAGGYSVILFRVDPYPHSRVRPKYQDVTMKVEQPKN